MKRQAQPANADDDAPFGIEAMRKRWTLAVGAVAWLGAIIAPALSFNVALTLNGDDGRQYQALLLILSAVLFLLAWRLIGRMRIWMLIGLLAASATLFVAYSIKKQDWTCAYAPAFYEGTRFTMGSELLPDVAVHLRREPPADASCETLMDPWGGDAMIMYERRGVVTHFLILFGLYTAAWLALGLLVLGAVRFSLNREKKG